VLTTNFRKGWGVHWTWRVAGGWWSGDIVSSGRLSFFDIDRKSNGAGYLCDITVKELVWVDNTLRVRVDWEGSSMATAQLGEQLWTNYDFKDRYVDSRYQQNICTHVDVRMIYIDTWKKNWFMLRTRQTRPIVSKVIGFMSQSAFVCIRLYEGASFSPDRLHNRPEAARYLLTLVTACSDRDTHTLSKFS
jgi:hypothetical protein